MTISLVSCNNKTITEKSTDGLYCDPKVPEATILFDEKNLLRFKTKKDTFDGKPVTWLCVTYAFYEKRQDTLYLSYPDLNSEKEKKIRTKYFWYDTSSAAIGLVLYKNAEKIADSLFKMHIDYAGEISSVIPEGKAVIKNGMVMFLPYNKQ